MNLDNVVLSAKELHEIHFFIMTCDCAKLKDLWQILRNLKKC